MAGLTDEKLMRRALTLARRGLPYASPNPAVGCVITRRGRIVAEGYHRGPNTPHGEADALNRLEGPRDELEVVVSLEPCASYPGKRSPACSDALCRLRPARVVVGCLDPNPAVRGRGIAALREAGIPVTVGTLESACQRMVEGFASLVGRGRPFVTLKQAISLDGKLAAHTGDAKWISNARSRRRVHRMRHESDAILVGAGTLAADNPRLTARPGRDPLRVIIDGRLRSDPTAQAFDLANPAATLLLTTLPVDDDRATTYAASVVGFSPSDGHVPLDAVLEHLGQRGIATLLVEGGAGISTAFLQAGLVDRLVLFIAPILVGEDGIPMVRALGTDQIRHAFRLESFTIERLDDNVMISGQPLRP